VIVSTYSARILGLLALAVCPFQALPRTYSPTRTGVNIWNVPVDIYTQSNTSTGTAYIANIANCQVAGTPTIQQCMQSYLQAWKSQGVTSIRFFIGLATPTNLPLSHFRDSKIPTNHTLVHSLRATATGRGVQPPVGLVRDRARRGVRGN